MTDKKEMSVNESLAKVNKILRSAGDLILPRETNIALSILADVACQQQEEIDALRERVQSQLPSDTSDVPERRTDKNLLIVLDALGCAPVLDVLGREPICNDTIKYARNLFLHIESKVKDLIKENETLRNAAKHEENNLTVTSNRIAMNGSINITHGTTVDNTCSNQNGVERKKMGCIRIEDNSGISVMPVESIVKIKQPKHSKNITEIMLSSGETDIYEVPIDEVLKAFKLGRTGQAEFKQATAGIIVYKGDMKSATLISTVREE